MKKIKLVTDMELIMLTAMFYLHLSFEFRCTFNEKNRKTKHFEMYAIALYNNTAETDDELNFKKNDVLEVLELDYDGLEGWWLCRLNNSMGLAAGNRLKILNLKQNNNRNSSSSTSSNDVNTHLKIDINESFQRIDSPKVCIY